MASSIGAQSFYSMSGIVPYAGWRLEDITRRGLAGIAFRVVQFLADTGTVETVTLCSTLTAAHTSLDAYYGLQGYLWTVVDDFGNTRYNVLVRRVSVVGITPVTSATDGSTSAVLRVRWELQDTAAVY